MTTAEGARLVIQLAYDAGRRAGKRTMQEPEKTEECWNMEHCGNVVPMICDDVSQEPGCLPRASYVPEDGMGYICKCDAVCCPQKSCGERSEKVCSLCCEGP